MTILSTMLRKLSTICVTVCVILCTIPSVIKIIHGLRVLELPGPLWIRPCGLQSPNPSFPFFLIRLEKVVSVPPQLKIFLTAVVDKMRLRRRKSAMLPPIGTTIVMTRCGSADNVPLCRDVTCTAVHTATVRVLIFIHRLR